jgi:4-hydroxy-3-polyprenylbenzoate decarboxylase
MKYSEDVPGRVRYIVAMTGASGSMYAERLLRELKGEKILVMSKMAKRVLEHETTFKVGDIEALADEVCDDGDLFAAAASGSYSVDAMIVVPCSSSSIAKIASGVADTLITRAAAVSLKESRKLILVVRETPKSQIMLENELRLARAGAVILDANPAFYSEPRTIDDIVGFVVGRCLDQLGQDHDLYRKWSGC